MQLSIKNIFGIVFICSLLAWLFGRLFAEADAQAWYEFSYSFYDLLWLFHLDWLWTFDPKLVEEWNNYYTDDTCIQDTMSLVGFVMSGIVHILLVVGTICLIIWFFSPSTTKRKK